MTACQAPPAGNYRADPCGSLSCLFPRWFSRDVGGPVHRQRPQGCVRSGPRCPGWGQGQGPRQKLQKQHQASDHVDLWDSGRAAPPSAAASGRLVSAWGPPITRSALGPRRSPATSWPRPGGVDEPLPPGRGPWRLGIAVTAGCDVNRAPGAAEGHLVGHTDSVIGRRMCHRRGGQRS